MVSRTTAALFALFALAVLPAATDARQDPPELLMTEVDPGRVERIRAYNGNLFERSIFYAKRWRVVEVRPEVLFSSGVVRISPFPDVELVLVRLERPDGRDADLTWAATVESPAVSKKERERLREERERDQAILGFTIDRNPELLPHETILRHEAKIDANLSVTPWYVDEHTGIARNGPPVVFPRLPASTKEQRQEEPDLHERSDVHMRPWPDAGPPNTIFSFGGTISDPVRGAQYRITPLDFSPRYHLIAEWDMSKDLGRIPPGPDRDLAKARLAEFEASLPPDQYPEEILGEIE